MPRLVCTAHPDLPVRRRAHHTGNQHGHPDRSDGSGAGFPCDAVLVDAPTSADTLARLRTGGHLGECTACGGVDGHHEDDCIDAGVVGVR